jgi:hypothetical protein
MSLNLPYPNTAMQGLQSRYHFSPTLSEGKPPAVDHRPGSTPHHSWPRLHLTSEILYPHGQTFGNTVPYCVPRRIFIAEPGAAWGWG